MKKITVVCEVHSDLDFLPNNAKYNGELIEVKNRRNPKSGRFESTLIVKITEFSREKKK